MYINYKVMQDVFICLAYIVITVNKSEEEKETNKELCGGEGAGRA